MERIKARSPQLTIIYGFLGIIIVGTILLRLPVATQTKEVIPLVDAFFTSTSAVCVTGLVVKDIGLYFSLFGQIVILCLIQIGGFGYMTMATFLGLLLGRKLSLGKKISLSEVLQYYDLEKLGKFLKNIILFTFGFEFIGALILASSFWNSFTPLKAIYLGIFHSVSAFCNAGFSLFSTNLIGYLDNGIICWTIIFLIFFGGIGYLVIRDLFLFRKNRLTLHSKVALSTSFLLILIGVILIFWGEFSNYLTLGNLSLKEKITASMFQAITPRTAGFNVINVGEMRYFTLLLTIFLMFIGASPGGTGGGIKTTTFAISFKNAISVARGKKDLNIFKKRIDIDTLKKSFAIMFLGLSVVGLFSLILFILEDKPFLPVIFEVFSAFGTVGLSCGITPTLSFWGKIIIMLVMFIGRLGPITIASAIMEEEPSRIRYPEEKIIVG